ncbi:hypothetical protein [Halorussus marinus]|uniref:hypothetical protein n=1 Tax=Halorussus marinus TaxID=2505976 RepID=UPI001092A9DC|nr:hypothetical protein [Halorussus marinus]
MSDPAGVEWRYDATRSRLLRVLAHGFVAGLGGALLLAAGTLLFALPALVTAISLGALLFVALLVLVGGPVSLVYLWPMLADPDQRPSPGAFAGDATPWTPRSVAVAAVAGAVGLWGLAAAGVGFDALFAVVVALVFSPVAVALFSTAGTVDLDGGPAGAADPPDATGEVDLVCNGRRVPLAQVTRVRSVRVAGPTIYWASYARGTGAFVPRLLTVPPEAADAVGAALDAGVETPAESPTTDPAVRAVVSGAGLLFVGVAVLGWRAVDDPVVGAYLAGVLGLVGALLCLAGWRGV